MNNQISQLWLGWMLSTSLLLLGGCSTLPQHTDAVAATRLQATPAQASHHELATQDKDPVPASLSLQDSAIDGVPMADDASSATEMAPVQLDTQALRHFGNIWDTLRAGMTDNFADNSRIDTQRSWFTSHQGYLNRMTDRAARYLAYTTAEAQRRHMPVELALLPVIESAYDPFAVSRSQATGIWQFVPGTRRIFGLRESWLYDGRRDIVDSTRAAYDFLSTLYNKYHDWNLVLAAYNAGPGIVDKAIARNIASGRPTDYWSLNLPAETMAYVPRFLAILQIVRNPELYGVQLSPIVNEPYFRIVAIPGQVDLNAVARLAGISEDDMRSLNPGFMHGLTDPMGPQRILVPVSVKTDLQEQLASLPPPRRTLTMHYRVHRGDDLFRIAHRFGMSTEQLAAMNHLHSGHLHRGEILMVNREESTATDHSSDDRYHTSVAQANPDHSRIHFIQIHHRSSLTHIAEHYHISVAELASWNHLSPHSTCRRGQKLKILQSTYQVAQATDEHHQVSRPDRKRIRYAVRRGDTLFSISRRYRVSVDEIRNWNHRSSRHRLHPGQDLVLYVADNNPDEG